MTSRTTPRTTSALRCDYCARFIGESAIEIQDLALATADDPDGWTGRYVCAPGVGCNVFDQTRAYDYLALREQEQR